MISKKCPGDTLDYGFDWSSWLKQHDGTVDVIGEVVWSVSGPDDSLVLDNEFTDGSVSGVWLSGGTVGGIYTASCVVTTVVGRVAERAFPIHVVDSRLGLGKGSRLFSVPADPRIRSA